MNVRVMAARAAANPTITGRFGEIVEPARSSSMAFQGKPRKAPRLTATQRDSAGRRSDWTRSPYAPRGGWR